MIENINIDGTEHPVADFSDAVKTIINEIEDLQQERARDEEYAKNTIKMLQRNLAKTDAFGTLLHNQLGQLVQKELAAKDNGTEAQVVLDADTADEVPLDSKGLDE